MTMKTAVRGTTILLSFVASGMLLFSLVCHPSNSYFQFMKVVILGSAIYVAMALYQRSERLTPFSLGLLALGVFEVFGKMRRDEWQSWNWATIGAFMISVILIGWRSKEKTIQAPVIQRPMTAFDEPRVDRDPTKTIQTSESIKMYDIQGTEISKVIFEPGKRTILEVSEANGFAGLLSGSALIFADTISEADRITISLWAGLSPHIWQEEHRQAFAAAMLSYLESDSEGIPDISDSLTALSKNQKPKLPAPLTPAVKAVFNRVLSE